MIRISLYIIAAILLALGAVWLADHPGNLHITWQAWDVRLSMATFSALALLYSLTLWFLFKLYRWFRTDNPLKSPKRRESRRQKGLRELDLGWSALAIEDRDQAIRHAKKAQNYLPGETAPLRLLLAASPDKDRVAYRQALQKTPEARVSALAEEVTQILTLEAPTRDALAAADKILLEMQNLTPKSPWVARKIFDLQIAQEKWPKARNSLDALGKLKVLDSTTQKHFAAIITYREAVEADLAGHKDNARDSAKQALKLDPGLIPAAVLLTRYYLSHDGKSAARKLLENSWKVAPHPDLVALFLELEPMESPTERFRRIQKFTALNPNALESRHLLARVALDTQHWQEAKATLLPLTQSDEATAETYRLLARLEQLQKKDDEAATAYLTQAASAPPDPAWRCQSCGTRHPNFNASCSNCHSFGKIGWR